MPAVNQVELNFWNPQPELVSRAKEHGVILEAYSPLGSIKQVVASLKVPEVKEIAGALCITPAQALISWQAQRGVRPRCGSRLPGLTGAQNIVLPKSVTPSGIEENLHGARRALRSRRRWCARAVYALPQDLFDKLEKAAAAHPPQRVVDPSKSRGVDIFDEMDE